MAGRKGRSGRRKGSKSYKRVGYGSIENRYGVRLTQSEQEEFRKLTQKANYQRKKRIKEIEKLSPVAANKYKTFGYESDFYYRRKSLSMHKFKSKNEFNNYMKSLRQMGSGRWIEKKARVYQESYKEKIRRTFAITDPNTGRWIHTKESLDLVKLVNKLDAKEFSDLVTKEEIDPLGEWYKGDDPYGRYLHVKNQLKRVVK